jgi:hypothetical protein
MRSLTAVAVRFSSDLESLYTTVVSVGEASAKIAPPTNVLCHFEDGTVLFESVTNV